jgi:hypothetical protein
MLNLFQYLINGTLKHSDSYRNQGDGLFFRMSFKLGRNLLL